MAPTVHFVPSLLPPGKLADAELHFSDGPLAGLKLIGFAVWERRTGGGRNVTFPSRTYQVNGERRSFALLREITSGPDAAFVRNYILDVYAQYERDTEDAMNDAIAESYRKDGGR